MSDFIYIEPKPIVTTTNIVGFKIDSIYVDIFNYASVRVVIYQSSNSVNRIETINLTKEEYSNWANDDNYIVDIVCNKLGFTRTSVQPSITNTAAAPANDESVPVDATL